MSSISRLLSKTFRRALAAEAAGDLEEAARSYAQAGRTLDLMRVRRLIAARATDPSETVSELRAALTLAEEAGAKGESARRQIQIDLARSLVKARGGDEGELEEASELFLSAGRYEEAADVSLKLERVGEAKALLARGRHYERLEELDRKEAADTAQASKRQAMLTSALEAHARGCRGEALEAFAEAAGEGESDVERLIAEIQRKKPKRGLLLELEGAGPPVRCLKSREIILGRGHDSPLPLRDPGVSRHHARISTPPSGTPYLEDLDSRNGTFVSNISIGARFPLEAWEGRFSLGPSCRLLWQRLSGSMLLTVDRGLSTGSKLLLMFDEILLEDLAPGFRDDCRLSVEHGWFIFQSERAFSLGDRRLPPGSKVELLLGDVVLVGGLRVGVHQVELQCR